CSYEPPVRSRWLIGVGYRSVDPVAKNHMANRFIVAPPATTVSLTAYLAVNAPWDLDRGEHLRQCPATIRVTGPRQLSWPLSAVPSGHPAASGPAVAHSSRPRTGPYFSPAGGARAPGVA